MANDRILGPGAKAGDEPAKTDAPKGQSEGQSEPEPTNSRELFSSPSNEGEQA